jgi:hypothetical protein
MLRAALGLGDFPLCAIGRMLPYAHRGSGSASVFVFVRQFQGDEIARNPAGVVK